MTLMTSGTATPGHAAAGGCLGIKEVKQYTPNIFAARSCLLLLLSFKRTNELTTSNLLVKKGLLQFMLLRIFFF